MKKLIPYPNDGSKRTVKGLILDHRAKVTAYANLLARSIVVKARSHDNSLAGMEEIEYTKWMGNQEISLSDAAIDKAIKCHYKNNDHHIEHFDNLSDMNIQQLSMCICDIMARASWITDDSDEFKRIIEDELSKASDPTIRSIMLNTINDILHHNGSTIKGAKGNEPEKEEK